MNTIQPVEIPRLSIEEAQELLEPYLSVMRDCIVAGWQAWERLGTIAPELRSPLSKQGRARFVYDHIVNAARARFDEIGGIAIQEKAGFITLQIFRDRTRAVVRFKKLDEKMKARNYPTQQQLDFSLQLRLPGWPEDATRLIAGYQLDQLETALKDMCVTCPVGSRVEWFFSISDSNSRIKEFPLPLGPQGPVIRPKDLKKEQETEE